MYCFIFIFNKCHIYIILFVEKVIILVLFPCEESEEQSSYVRSQVNGPRNSWVVTFILVNFTYVVTFVTLGLVAGI